MNLETEETFEMVVEGARETVIKLNNDGLSNGPCAGNKRDVDSKESEEEVGNQEKDSKAGDDGMFIVCEDDIREENLMGSEDAKDIEALTDAITKNDDTNTTKEVLLLPKKKVLKRKKIVKKRKLVKRKVTIAKDEEKSQPSDVPDPTVEVRANQDGKNEENPAGKTINDSLPDKQEFAASVDMQNNEADLAGEVGDDEMFIVPEDDVREESVMGSEDGKDLESLTDAITMNEKEEALNDDTNTTKDTLLPKKKVLKQKKVLKKRKLVKGKTAIAKDEEKPQSSDMPDPSAEVGPNQYVQNEENLDGMNNVNNSSTVRTKQKNAQQKTGKVSVKSKQTEKNKQDEKEKMASESEKMDDMNEEAKSESRVKLSKITLREVIAEDNDGAEPSNKPNSSNKVETMGMIFMCSSKTKEDCYRYKIMGLPAGKKDAVLKVYKGMRLFLFDFELKLLYGIYKAAAPGGYNLEPNAFKSNFPSQVRFTAVRESTPLPEEKFKMVIKDNYYTKNKFSSELNSEQVKRLCKLFQLANKASKSKAKAVTERPKVGVRPTVERENKRRAGIGNDDRGRERRDVADSGRDNKRRRVVDNVNLPRAAGNVRGSRAKGNAARERAKGAVVRPRVEDGIRRTRLEDEARRSRAEDNARRSRFEDDARRSRIEDEERLLRADEDARRLRFEDGTRRLRLETEERRLREDDARRLRADDRRHSPLALNDNRYLRHADVYGRETYLPTALPAPLHLDALPPPALPPYTGSVRTSLLGDYRLDMAIENEDRGLAYSRPRHLYDYQSPYLPPREPVVYRDPGYDVSTSRSYYPPAASRDDYLLSSSRTSRYGLSPHRRY